ncbi:Endonuclease/exonuclease/phosphatase [Alternaria rosae]|uniref:Endonuclease/exonuclease/phosphatase n=1 Tax=Alternaria rosae TaxID=1187941 RepID=UPI001E8D16A3|nr:Endonuclease/exonuclease/phosphatase [Alternaria rosae]KAH6870391.1 Endonuclease/exonuclease/phosphatase [Alternaria rosae]
MSPVKPTPAMQAAAATFSSNIQKREDAFYEPRKQPYYYTSSDSNWKPAAPGQTFPKDESELLLHPTKLRLISWNIDVLVPFPEERMSAALDHLHDLVSSTPPENAIVIFLQEMGVSDMEQIRDSAWVKQRFNLTDIDSQNWLSSHYGTTTLIDRRVHIDSVFRVPWYSKFGRDGLFVDIKLYNSIRPDLPVKLLRLCNTHLESLVADPPVRPVQMAAAKQYLNHNDVESAILAGDLNAIEPFDRSLHTDNELEDMYLLIGEDSDNGYTWGYQSPQAMRDRFGCSRMDKILFQGWLAPWKFQRIGMGVKVAEEHRQMMKEAGELDWVSDHYGVMGDFSLAYRGQLTKYESRQQV